MHRQRWIPTGAFNLPRRPSCIDRQTQLYGHITSRYNTAEAAVCTFAWPVSISMRHSFHLVYPKMHFRRATGEQITGARAIALSTKNTPSTVSSQYHGQLAKESKQYHPRPWQRAAG